MAATGIGGGQEGCEQLGCTQLAGQGGREAGGVHYAEVVMTLRGQSVAPYSCVCCRCRCHACIHAVPGATPLEQLMSDAMTLAAAKGYDVFNALDLLEVR